MGIKDLREQAAAKFAEAKKFADDHGLNDENAEPKEEDLVAVKAILDDARQLDVQFAKAAEREGIKTEIGERFDYYSQKAGGTKLGLHKVYEEGEQVSLGRAFVESDEYKQLVDSGALQSDQASFRMQPIKLAASDIISTGTGGAGGLITPQYLPGVLPLPQRPLHVRELFSQAQATSDSISYAAQVSFDSAAAAVSQAHATNQGAKPQSAISWERRTAPVETIATWMAATRQSLADAGQIQSLIDNQGRLMLGLVEEDEILSGNGTPPHLKGLLNTPGVQTYGAFADNLDAIRVARRMVRTGPARLNADAIVMHPVDSEEFDLLKDGVGLYRGGNPIGNFNYDQNIWGLTRVESEAVAEGTAIVGAFKAGGTVFERQGITVYTTDSHSDFFVRNLIAVLFEERLALAVFFPAGFVKMTLHSWGTAGSGTESVVS